MEEFRNLLVHLGASNPTVVTRKNVALCDVTLYSLVYVYRVFDTPTTSVIRVRAVLSLTTWAQLPISQHFFFEVRFLVKEVNKE